MGIKHPTLTHVSYSKTVKENDISYFMIIAVYVDDFTLASDNLIRLEKEKKNPAEKCDMVDQGEINYILGMSITRNQPAGVL